MTVVKAEYLVTQDSESGEEQNVKFVPPVPSDGDLGGISKEDSEQIAKNKNDIDDIRMTLWDKILDKLTSAVVGRLNTTNKTVIGAINELNSKAKSGIIYNIPVTFKLYNSSIYILICAHSSGKPVISVFTTYDNKILHTQLSEPSYAKIEVSGMNVIVTVQYTHIYSLVKVS